MEKSGTWLSHCYQSLGRALRDVMIGPFASEAEAQSWAKVKLSPLPDIAYDVLAYGAHWYCDLFLSSEQ